MALAEKYINTRLYQSLITGITTALDINEGIVKLVGPLESGKTFLCQQLVVELESSGHQVLTFFTPPASSQEMQQAILSNLELGTDKNFTRTLTQHLSQFSRDSKKLVIIFDDAEKISDEVFLSIRLLSNIQDDSQALIRLVLCGDDELDKKLSTLEYRSLAQYLSQSFTLSAMNKAELEVFCGLYANLTDAPGLDKAGLKRVYKQSRGLPGKVCDCLNSSSMADIDTPEDTGKAWASTLLWRIKISFVIFLLIIAVPVGYILLDLKEDEFAEVVLVISDKTEVQINQETTEPVEAENLELHTQNSSQEVISAAISTWLDSWQAQNIDAYFSHYHKDFKPLYANSNKLWRENRRERILSAENIAISFDRLSITETLEDSITVRFWISYSSKGYTDETWKEIRWKLSGERWLIAMERNRKIVRIE